MKKLLLTPTLLLLQGLSYAQETRTNIASTNVVGADTSSETGAFMGSMMNRVFGVGTLLLVIFSFIFFVRMLVDVIKHQKKDKALWIIIILLTGILGSIVYYFAARKPRKKEEKESQIQE